MGLSDVTVMVLGVSLVLVMDSVVGETPILSCWVVVTETNENRI